MGKTILVIGATGGIGGAVAQAFLAQGWRVRSLSRHPPADDDGPGAQAGLQGIEWHRGDALNVADVVNAACGVEVIFHGVNPPRYRRWRELALPMLAHSIEAARTSGARLIFPGNVYNFGPDAGAVVDEGSPQHPVSRKGLVRVEMERMLHDAARLHGVRSLIVRAGDFFGGHAPSSWFSTVIVRPGRPLRSVTFPGCAGVGHAWAYLPDLARAVVRLAERQHTLPDVDTFHFAGHWLAHGTELVESIRRVSGQPNLPVRALPWWLVTLASPGVPLFREILEMRYLWQTPLRLDNRKLVALIGEEPHTELDVAVHQSLTMLGCLSPRSTDSSASSTSSVRLKSRGF